MHVEKNTIWLDTGDKLLLPNGEEIMIDKVSLSVAYAAHICFDRKINSKKETNIRPLKANLGKALLKI